MLGNPVGNGHGNGWSTSEKQATWSSLEEGGQTSRGSWLKGWIGPLGGFRESRRRTSRLIPTFTHQASLRQSTLTPPVSASTLRFVLLCSLWYMSSAMSSNTGKAILNQFRYPVTLTFVQFGFVSGYSLLFASPLLRFTRVRAPTRAIIRNTLPMAVFQVIGHVFSSVAIARVPVSTVHTIKALSPLFTVAAYALLFRVRYSAKTYISLLPLTAGVMLACSFDVSASNYLGLLSAFGSAIVFVSSNIFFKKVMPSPSASAGPSTTPAHKLDKLNLLFYSSGLAFLLMIPVWVYSDLPTLLSPVVGHPPHPSPHSVTYYFFWNGTVHFGQNIIAFAILSTTSPVTYSIASLIKRIAVILIAIVWFNQNVHPIQACGITLTGVGLWMYNNAKGDVERGEKKMLQVEAERQLLLPSTERERRMMDPTASPRISGEMEKKMSMHGRGVTIATSISQNHTTISPTVLSHPPSSFPHPLSSSLHIHTQSHNNGHMYNHRGSAIVPPIESYPSPPPSLDSPPDDMATFQAGLRPQRIPQAA